MFLEPVPMPRGLQPQWDVKVEDLTGIPQEWVCEQKQPLHQEVRLHFCPYLEDKFVHEMRQLLHMSCSPALQSLPTSMKAA